MSAHRHRFHRLSDVAIYCECGEIRESPFQPVVPFPSTPHLPIVTPYAPVVIPIPTAPVPRPVEPIRWSS